MIMFGILKLYILLRLRLIRSLDKYVKLIIIFLITRQLVNEII